MVPVTAADTALSGATLEALNCNGYNYVIPALINTTFKDKYSRDEYSVKNVDIVFNNRTISLGEAFLSTYFCDESVMNIITKYDGNTASYIEKNLNSIQKQIEKLNDSLSAG